MYTGITGTTHTLFEIPYMIYPTEHHAHTLQLHNIQQQNNNLTQKYCESTNTVRHATPKTNGSTDRAIKKIQGYNVTLTTTQVQ